jgi:hypothetical protein
VVSANRGKPDELPSMSCRLPRPGRHVPKDITAQLAGETFFVSRARGHWEHALDQLTRGVRALSAPWSVDARPPPCFEPVFVDAFLTATEAFHFATLNLCHAENARWRKGVPHV